LVLSSCQAPGEVVNLKVFKTQSAGTPESCTLVVEAYHRPFARTTIRVLEAAESFRL
jgi:hypothetical protein